MYVQCTYKGTYILGEGGEEGREREEAQAEMPEMEVASPLPPADCRSWGTRRAVGFQVATQSCEFV